MGIFFAFFVSCKTQKELKTGKQTQKQTETQKQTQTKGSIQNVLEYSTLNISKATFTLAQKQSSFSTNGSIRIKKDSIIIISFQPLLGIEAVRACLTQNTFTLVDRINRRYFSSDFAFLKKQLGVEINYNIFQSILTNSLFVYDNPDAALAAALLATAFKEVRMGDLLLLQAGKKGINQEFTVGDKQQVQSGRLFDESYSLEWNYLRFSPLENGHVFPHLVKITVPDGKKRNQLDILYNKIEVNKNINFQFSVPSAYTKVSWDELLKILQ